MIGMIQPGIVGAITHAALLLAVSFFVVLAVGKLNGGKIVLLGWITAALLWLAAGLVLVVGVSCPPCGPPMMQGLRGDLGMEGPGIGRHAIHPMDENDGQPSGDDRRSKEDRRPGKTPNDQTRTQGLK